MMRSRYTYTDDFGCLIFLSWCNIISLAYFRESDTEFYY